MQSSLVSVVCLCHNQAEYVEEAIQSVTKQTHPNIQLIVVDDGSEDASKTVISALSKQHDFTFISLEQALGNCRAFNQALKKCQGAYVIDLAADDLLLPNRIEEGLKTFDQKEIGVEFCNVENVDPKGNTISIHFKPDQPVFEKDIYEKLITTYFISPPGMMMKKEVLDELDGYDESLSYEDFDFWIRSSRDHHYGYTPQILVKKRDVPGSLSKKQFAFQSSHQRSTLAVCKKIKQLNRLPSEQLALKKRCMYEIKQCLKQGNFSLLPAFLKLYL
ncbi:MAG: glycosyltransferase [Bacteroidota bacterium]